MTRRRNSWVPPTPVTTKDPTVRAILRAIGSKAVKATIAPAREVEYFGTYWDGGSRAEFTAVSLSTFKAVHGPQFDPPQFGGPRKAPVVDVPRGIVIVEHGISCGKPARPRINVNPDDLVKLLPAGTGGSELPRGNPMSGFKTMYGVSPEDHTRGRGGFNGEFFKVIGITDATFPSEAAAIAAIQRRFPRWRMTRPQNMSGPVFTSPAGPKHLCIYQKQVRSNPGSKKPQRPYMTVCSAHLCTKKATRIVRGWPFCAGCGREHARPFGAPQSAKTFTRGRQNPVRHDRLPGGMFTCPRCGGTGGSYDPGLEGDPGFYSCYACGEKGRLTREEYARFLSGERARRKRSRGRYGSMEEYRNRHNPGLSNWAGGPEHTWVYPDGSRVSRGDTVRYSQYAGRGMRGPEYRPATGRVYLIGPAGAVVGNSSRSGGTGTVVTDETFIALVRKAK